MAGGAIERASVFRVGVVSGVDDRVGDLKGKALCTA